MLRSSARLLPTPGGGADGGECTGLTEEGGGVLHFGRLDVCASVRINGVVRDAGACDKLTFGKLVRCWEMEASTDGGGIFECGSRWWVEGY